MAEKDDYLIDSLINMGLVMEDEVAPLREEALANEEGLVDLLVSRGVIREEDVIMAKAAHFGSEVVHLSDINVEDDAIAAVPRHIATKYNVVPVFKTPDSLTVALSDPSDLDTIDSLHHLLNQELVVQVATPGEIETAISRYYGKTDDSVSRMIQDITEGDVDLGLDMGALDDDAGGDDDADAPLIKLVNSIIVEAFKARASDIHLEPLEHSFRMRYRVDGVCHELQGPPKRLQPSIISRLKIMSNMSIQEKRIPQDGRIQASVPGKKIDLRVSCLPTTHGESIVMRILDKEGVKLGLGQLGFFADDEQTFERLIGLPDGILLVTGPTGSGKTTTLYAVLNYINRPDRKIITVEDPVEYQLSGINQVQVSEVVGLTFSNALRAMLRQAPNVVMLGEIRDMETATIAINASLTGHLVFSTLHTNDAPSAVTRLIDIGVKPFLIASGTRGLMAQRLVRRICANCGEDYAPTPYEIESLNFTPEELKNSQMKMGKGCGKCSKGYRGRFGIYEIFVIDDEVRKLIFDQAPSSVLRARSREMGMRSLRQDGARKALAGMTSPEEVIAITSKDIE